VCVSWSAGTGTYNDTGTCTHDTHTYGTHTGHTLSHTYIHGTHTHTHTHTNLIHAQRIPSQKCTHIHVHTDTQTDRHTHTHTHRLHIHTQHSKSNTEHPVSTHTQTHGHTDIQRHTDTNTQTQTWYTPRAFRVKNWASSLHARKQQQGKSIFAVLRPVFSCIAYSISAHIWSNKYVYIHIYPSLSSSLSPSLSKVCVRSSMGTAYIFPPPFGDPCSPVYRISCQDMSRIYIHIHNLRPGCICVFAIMYTRTQKFFCVSHFMSAHISLHTHMYIYIWIYVCICIFTRMSCVRNSVKVCCSRVRENERNHGRRKGEEDGGREPLNFCWVLKECVEFRRQNRALFWEIKTHTRTDTNTNVCVWIYVYIHIYTAPEFVWVLRERVVCHPGNRALIWRRNKRRTPVYTCVYVCICVYVLVFMYTCIYVCMYICVCIYIYIFMSICMYIFRSLHI